MNNNSYNFFDFIYHLASSLVIGAIINDSILCPVFNIGLRGSANDTCGEAVFLVLASPVAITWFIMTFFALHKAKKLRQENHPLHAKALSWPWKIIVLFYVFIFIYTLIPIFSSYHAQS